MAFSFLFRRQAILRITAASLSLCLPLAAQQSGPVLHTAPASSASVPSTQSSDAKLINIPVVVHDKHGAVIPDLTKDSFQLWADKKPVEIRTFTRDTTRPLTLGLLVDVSFSQREALADERKASAAFLDTMLSAADTAFVAQFARQTDLLQDVSGSKPKLHDGLQQLGTASANDPSDRDDRADSTGQNGGNSPGSTGGNSGGSPGNPRNNGPYGRGGRGSNVPVVGVARRPNSVLYDALFLSLDELMSKQQGRKVLIVLSDGHDHGSKESLASAIEAAQRADTVVYAIFFKGQQGKPDHSDRGFSIGDPNQCDPYGPPGGYPGSYPPYGYPGGGYPGDCTPTPQTGSVESADGRKTLQRITSQTGGRLFEMDKKTTLADIYKQIGDDLHAQYLLTFAPDKDASSDGYHRIDVSLQGDPKDRFVETREGYFAGPPD